MAMFTLIELNGDHISDCDPEELGRAVQAATRNPSNHQYAEYHAKLAIRVVRQSGNSIQLSKLEDAGLL